MFPVFIDRKVHEKIRQFYEASMQLHISLDEKTVQKKMQRIYEGLEKLGRDALTYRKARLLSNWIEAGYRECIVEDLYVHDACHSLLYH